MTREEGDQVCQAVLNVLRYLRVRHADAWCALRPESTYIYVDPDVRDVVNGRHP